MIAPPDDVVLFKLRAIERGVFRAREVYHSDPSTFAADITRQDAAIMNIQRACMAALDCGQHLIRRERLGIPASAGDVFSLLSAGGWITGQLASSLQSLVDFRDLAIHNDRAVQPADTVAVVRDQLDSFLAFTSQISRAGGRPGPP
jgi:uncharacterized protein YutE (UPF0331/DUF86 family)